ncbi:hypothetical protein CANMA_002827 [Candida margitis]|uniref:uncharacterized protein n=1 Tax=Candida margitis TaxID=1775924 RepID=UPI0022266D2D|nr:uncharacterized protein CANMA_002827 [Candida margitis]KAI5967647.1 hypothetical protein CANMA_002827 [Candida margitis]
MSKSNNHSNNTSSSNLRRYGDDELESSIGAIFDNIDFSSMEKPEVNDEGASLESNNRRLSENRSQYSTNDNDDGMKDAINNALNDVFDFRDKHNEEEGKNNLQGFKDVDESKHPTHGYTEGDTLPKSTELNSAPSVPENQELDDAIDSAFDNLLQDQVPSQGEKSPKEDSHKVRHQEDLALVSEINSLMQTGAQEEVQNNSVKALSTRRDKPSETEIPSSLVKGELDQERKEADNYFASKSVEVDNEDDDLDLAIRSALGNIFEKESAEATAENKDQVK